ncbi:MAG: leucine-rich repeat protein [Clostridia bacterium]|nr:leucine-rich repeat protein [Clostridia bacterium]
MLKKGMCWLLTICLAALAPGISFAEELQDPPAVTQESEPAPVEQPTETEKPAPTEPPAETEKPTPTEKPAETEKPTPTEKPAETEKPTPTEKPAETEKPAPTDPPAETEKPAPTDPPAETEKPAPTDPPAETEKPVPTATPENTEHTEPTDEPGPTENPEPTGDPGATESPTPSDEPESAFVIEGDVLLRYTGEEKVVTLPDGIRIVGREAFLNHTTLETVILPDTVEEIRERAFADCSRLKEVVTSSDSRLEVIGSRAFQNCVKIRRDFAKDIGQVAADAFEGVPEPAETTEPAETPEPARTPEPPETPEPEEETEPEEPEDPYEDIEWEEPVPMPGGGGGGGGKWQPHARSRLTMTHDYDQVQLDGLENAGPMEILTLGDEQLQIGLKEGLFTMSLMEEQNEGDLESQMVLTAEDSAVCLWEINGAGLRKLHKSGIDTLILRNGEHTLRLPTEGFLAGWKYEELKSRGTAGRRFTYLVEMTEASSRWQVMVEDLTMELGTDPHAEIYLTGVEEEVPGAEPGDDLGRLK